MKIIQKISMVAVIVLVVFVLGACGSQKLSEDFDEQTVKEAAETSIALLSANDLEGFCALPMSDEMQEAMTEETLSAVCEQYLAGAGELAGYKSTVAVGSKDEAGNDCAVVVVAAEYEERNVTYTISFNKEMELIGFFLK